jgi:predicted peptidase
VIRRRHLLMTSPALLSACAMTPSAPPAPPIPAGLAAGEQRAFALAGERMWVWLPKDYAQRPQPWPLVIFLHGSGERGTELEKVKVHGPPKLVAAGAAWPAILVSPQLEDGARWDPERLHRLLVALKAQLNVDARQCLGTGLSLGGYGMWHWATAYPRDLAAIAPVCGFGDPTKVAAMRDVPVRGYHGDKDTVVPLAGQQACVDALNAAGGKATLTVYPGVGHDSWTPAYNDPDLLPWLLAQRQT